MSDRVSPEGLRELAEAWASIDGHLDEFLGAMASPEVDAITGRYSGYMEDARELLARTAKRGFVLIRSGPGGAT